MPKVIKQVDITIMVTKNELGEVIVRESADLMVGLDDYPDFEPRRKGIPITLTPTQETAIINHVKNVVLPQAELAK